MAKNLVLYFSVYGTAKKTAEEIARQTGADLVDIEPVIPYDSNRDHYNQLAAYAKKEHDEDMHPAIKNDINISGYDNIFIGYPMWWYTFPIAIYSFLDEYDLSGKTIIPFAAHEGSRFAGGVEAIKKAEPDATVIEDGYSVRGNEVSDKMINKFYDRNTSIGGWPGKIIENMKKDSAGAKHILEKEILFDSKGGPVLQTPLQEIEQWIEEINSFITEE